MTKSHLISDKTSFSLNFSTKNVRIAKLTTANKLVQSEYLVRF